MIMLKPPREDILLVADEVPPWVNTNFPNRTPISTAGGLAEEVGELMRCIVKMDQGIRGTREEWITELRKEIGDVFIKLVDVGDYNGVDTIDCIIERWQTIKKRNFIVDPIGHGLPTDDEPQCPNCDGSGYVSRLDGSLAGVCDCPAGGTPLQTPKPDGVSDEQRERWGRLSEAVNGAPSIWEADRTHRQDIDAEFIAEARVAVPALLEENKALTEERDYYLTEARGWIRVAYANASETDAAKAEADQLRAQVAELTAQQNQAEIEAWDEGFDQGRAYENSGGHHDGKNPYREAARHAEDPRPHTVDGRLIHAFLGNTGPEDPLCYCGMTPGDPAHWPMGQLPGRVVQAPPKRRAVWFNTPHLYLLSAEPDKPHGTTYVESFLGNKEVAMAAFPEAFDAAGNFIDNTLTEEDHRA